MSGKITSFTMVENVPSMTDITLAVSLKWFSAYIRRELWEVFGCCIADMDEIGQVYMLGDPNVELL